MSTEPSEGGGGFRCFTATSENWGVRRQGNAVTVYASGDPVLDLASNGKGPERQLRILRSSARDERQFLHAALAAIEPLFAEDAAISDVMLEGGDWATIGAEIRNLGIAHPGDVRLRILPELFWQLRDPWLPNAEAPPMPLHYAMTDGKRHPIRAGKPKGTVYSRHIPWLAGTFSFRTLEIASDLDLFHRWMNGPRVAYFWQEEGDLEKHRAYLSAIEADPHMMTLLGCLDGAPFCYFEIYWAKENRLGPYYDAGDFDRGWHVAVGEDGYRGRDYVATWLPSLMHYLFLDDPRTQRIVGEPRADHAQQIRNLERSGFASIKEFDFPHKRAMLVTLLRERYFGERLWIPRRGDGATLPQQRGTAA